MTSQAYHREVARVSRSVVRVEVGQMVKRLREGKRKYTARRTSRLLRKASWKKKRVSL